MVSLNLFIIINKQIGISQDNELVKETAELTNTNIRYSDNNVNSSHNALIKTKKTNSLIQNTSKAFDSLNSNPYFKVNLLLPMKADQSQSMPIIIKSNKPKVINGNNFDLITPETGVIVGVY